MWIIRNCVPSLNAPGSLFPGKFSFTSFDFPCKYTCGMLWKQEGHGDRGNQIHHQQCKLKVICVSWENVFSRLTLFTMWSADWPVHPLLLTSHKMRHGAHTRTEIQAKQPRHYTTYCLGQLTFLFVFIYFFGKSLSRKGRMHWLDFDTSCLSSTVPGHTGFVKTVKALCPLWGLVLSQTEWGTQSAHLS